MQLNWRLFRCFRIRVRIGFKLWERPFLNRRRFDGSAEIFKKRRVFRNPCECFAIGLDTASHRLPTCLPFEAIGKHCDYKFPFCLVHEHWVGVELLSLILFNLQQESILSLSICWEKHWTRHREGVYQREFLRFFDFLYSPALYVGILLKSSLRVKASRLASAVLFVSKELSNLEPFKLLAAHVARTFFVCLWCFPGRTINRLAHESHTREVSDISIFVAVGEPLNCSGGLGLHSCRAVSLALVDELVHQVTFLDFHL